MQQALATDPSEAAAPDEALTMEEWMRLENLDDLTLGERIGKDKTTVWRVRTGKMRASYDFIEQVVIASDGRVRPDSFFKRALHKAAASRGVTPTAPFSSTSSPLARPADANPRPSRTRRQPACSTTASERKSSR